MGGGPHVRHAGYGPDRTLSATSGLIWRTTAGWVGEGGAACYSPPASRGETGVDKTHTLDVDWVMAPDFNWNEDKNQRLVEQRGISFERIVSAIEQGGLVDVLEHPNQERYRGEMIYVVDIEQYLYLVPFVTGADGTRFLKTIIPSRKATRDYQRRRSS